MKNQAASDNSKVKKSSTTQVKKSNVDKSLNSGLATIPSVSVEINSGNTDSSGLKLTNLTSSSPVSSGATLGVDNLGNVVTVEGASFTPAFGRVLTSSSIIIPADTVNYNILSFTLPASGTYLIIYSIRAQVAEVSGQKGQGYAVSFISTAPSAGNVISNTEILLYDLNEALEGGTGTGSLVISVAKPTTYYVGIRCSMRDARIFNNNNGRSSVNYVKVTP
ncbi:hypothetical protein OWR28_14775 [Chryseobacterium sp. 1B4]